MPRRIPFAALGLMLFQLVLVLFVTGGKLRSLVHWDVAWYRDIAAYGYQVTLPLQKTVDGTSNIAFFPGFPVFARGVMRFLRLDPELGIAVAAQIACIGLWLHFLLLLRRLGARRELMLASCVLFLAQPGAFYTVIGYSESLFSAALLGYVYWSTRLIEDDRRKPLHFLLAALHGGFLSCTRILGVVLTVYPLLLACARALKERRLSGRPLALAASLAALSLGGFAAYIGYCHFRWGQWDLYWEANRVGWGVQLDTWKIFHWSYYRDVFFIGNLSEVLGRILTVLTVAGSFALARWAWRSRMRNPLLPAIALLSLGLQFETIIGSHGMHSMIRYLIPIHALTLPLAAAWAEERIRRKSASRPWPSFRAWVTAAGLTVFLLAIEVMFAIRFGRNDWVS